MSEPINTVLAAAAWATERLSGSTHIRDAAAVAGRVQACTGATLTDAVVAWLYRVCEAPNIKLSTQQSLLAEIQERCTTEVANLLRSLVTPAGSTNIGIKQAFLRSTPDAQRIRACETIVGVAQAALLLMHGSVASVEPVRVQLDFAKFVYNNSQNLDSFEKGDLFQLMTRLHCLCQAVDATSRVFYEKVSPPGMVPVRFLAVMNENEVVALSCLPVDAGPALYRTQFQLLREQVGGNAVTETVLEATLPMPKWGAATPVIEIAGTLVPSIVSTGTIA